MKKIVLLIIMIFVIVSCGVTCPSAPQKRAYFHQSNEYNMRYHISIYLPTALSPHSPTVKCSEYEYSKIDLYTDDLGEVRGDRLIWKSIYGDVNFSDYGENPANIMVYFSKEKVVITGWNTNDDGTYKVETTSPDNWGVPIN